MFKAPAHTWSPEDDEKLVDFIKAGWSCRQMAEYFDRERNAVIGRIFRQNLREKAKEEEREDAEASAKKTAEQKAAAAAAERLAQEKRYETFGSICAAPGCLNNRLPGYLHGLCSKHNAERLMDSDRVNRGLREIT